jgi:hypothetical protein
VDQVRSEPVRKLLEPKRGDLHGTRSCSVDGRPIIRMSSARKQVEKAGIQGVRDTVMGTMVCHAHVYPALDGPVDMSPHGCGAPWTNHE